MNLYNKINKYKLIFILSFIFLSGCNLAAHIQFKNECRKLPKNYFDKDLMSFYEKEKYIHIIDDQKIPCSRSYLCSLIERSDRWDNIQMITDKGVTYNFYRDYEFKNCISDYSNWGENNFLNSNGKYCVAYKFTKEIQSNILYVKKETLLYKKNGKEFSKIEDKIFIKNKLFLSYNSLRFHSNSSQDYCDNDGISKEIYLNDFSWSK